MMAHHTRLKIASGTLLSLLASGLALAAAPFQAYAANPQPIMTFFVPLPEDQTRASLYAISTATSMTMHAVTGISITSNNTVIYYDQWENGYDVDIANPANLYSPINPGGRRYGVMATRRTVT